ncbi:MAG: SAM-dependent DNA methyltransferase, partial [Chloroflexota bacterium]
PSPRRLEADEVFADDQGAPLLADAQYLLNCPLPEQVVQRDYPELWRYLQRGVALGIKARYLCAHRSPWYAQEQRPAAPFVCTYMGRQVGAGSRPFRFILNHSRATAANVYLMLYPREPLKKALIQDPQLKWAIWQALNAISQHALFAEGRVYGGGLHKLEPKELGSVPAAAILDIMPRIRLPQPRRQPIQQPLWEG